MFHHFSSIPVFAEKSLWVYFTTIQDKQIIADSPVVFITILFLTLPTV
jgi:hypothetical protein